MTTTVSNPKLSGRFVAATGVVFLALALTACSHIPTAQELMGMWATVPVATERGATSEEFCFSPDGSLEWTTRAPGRTTKQRGTFKLVGDALTIETPDLDAPLTLKTIIKVGKLVLTSPKGSTQKYSKIAATCEDQDK